MQSKISSSKFGISKALIKEDFRRFWAIPVIAFIGYFLTGIFYILVNYDYLTDSHGTHMAYFIDDLLKGQFIGYIANMIWVPLLSSVLIFRYLHKTGHVMSTHSQPFSRSTLLNSHAASCALFSILPILATAVILMAISKPVYYPASTYTDKSEIVNLFARGFILNWAWDSILVSMFVLMICILGGMAAGTTFHHAVAAAGFNVVIPVCLFFQETYYDIYLFGYDDNSFIENLAKYSSPAILQVRDGFFSITENLLYVAVTLGLFALVHFMYSRRKLERATDGVVFKTFDVITTLIFGYLGMTIVGLSFHSIFNQSTRITTLGYIVGAILGMVICRMIIMKSIKIANKATLKIMIGYLVIAIAFMACLAVDITGFEKRIPDNADGVVLEMDGSILGISSDNYYGTSQYFADDETVEAVKGIHQLIIDNKSLFEDMAKERRRTPVDYDVVDNEEHVWLTITYYKSTDESDREKILRRNYSIPAYMLLNSSEIEAFTATPEYRERIKSVVPEANTVVNIDVTGGDLSANHDGGYSITDQAQIKGFIDAYEKDLDNLDSEAVRKAYAKYPVAYVNISFRSSENQKPYEDITEEEFMEITGGAPTVSAEDLSKAGYYNDITFEISPAYSSTIGWLKANGYGDVVEFNPGAFEFLMVYNFDGVYNKAITYDEKPVSEDGIIIMENPEKYETYVDVSRAHEVYGRLSELSTEEDDLYGIIFYEAAYDSTGAFEGYYPIYHALIEGKYL